MVIVGQVMKDMEKDEDELPETRWPFFPGGRRKVAPTPVPAVPPLSQAELESLENKSARQRRLAIEQARRSGAFDDRSQKEAKAANKRIKQVCERAGQGYSQANPGVALRPRAERTGYA